MSEHFDVTWGDPTLYDLTLNTERLAIPRPKLIQQVTPVRIDRVNCHVAVNEQQDVARGCARANVAGPRRPARPMSS